MIKVFIYSCLLLVFLINCKSNIPEARNKTDYSQITHYSSRSAHPISSVNFDTIRIDAGNENEMTSLLGLCLNSVHFAQKGLFCRPGTIYPIPLRSGRAFFGYPSILRKRSAGNTGDLWDYRTPTRRLCNYKRLAFEYFRSKLGRETTVTDRLAKR